MARLGDRGIVRDVGPGGVHQCEYDHVSWDVVVVPNWIQDVRDCNID